MIKPDTIQNILDAVRIEEVINDFVPLKRRGVNFIGLCPFHNEKTPSFIVSPSKGIFKCFGCGKSGNAVGFIMEHEHYSYPEALKYLAGKYGIEVEEEEMSPEMKEQFDERERMFLLNSFISGHFRQNLFETEDGKAIGLTYLKERGFRESTIKKFQLGYAANAWQEYSEFALRNGYKKDVLIKTGLSIEKDGRLIDRFKGRVIFPIHNLTGKVIGFGGRILTTEKQTAKYLNSPESDIYNKSKSLYGIYFAKSAIAKADNCYLVEGYTDVIQLHQAGIENVVASSGTSLTVEQIKLIKRFTHNITILYDGDTAGIKASFRGIDLILEQGMNVKIVLFPEGEDPDSYVRSHRKSEVDELLTKNSSDFITFKTKLLLEETAGDPAKKAELIREIILSISKIPDGIARNVYIKECSTVMDIPEQTLVNELNKLLRQRYRNRLRQQDDPVFDQTDEKGKAPKIEEIDPFDTRNVEKEVLRLALLYGNRTIEVTYWNNETDESVVTQNRVASYIVNEILQDGMKFENETYQKIFDIISKKVFEDQPVNEKEFINVDDEKIASAVIDIVTSPYELSKNWEKHKIFVETEESDLSNNVVRTVSSFRVKNILRKIKSYQDELKNETDQARQKVIMMEIFALKSVVVNIDKELKRVFSY